LKLLGSAGAGVDSIGMSRGRDYGVPPRVERECAVGGRQIEPGAAGFRADQEELARRFALELRDALAAVARAAVEMGVREAARVEPMPHRCEEARELPEDQRLVPFLDDFVEPLEEELELRARLAAAASIDQRRVASRLAQPQQRLVHVDLRTRETLLLDSFRE